MDIRRLVGCNIARIRKQRDLTQEQIAESSGLSQQYLSGIEQGQRNPTLLTLDRLAKALQVSVAQLADPQGDAARQD